MVGVGGTVRRAVAVEFDRYIISGDLARTVARLDKTRAERAATGDPRGMYL